MALQSKKATETARDETLKRLAEASAAAQAASGSTGAPVTFDGVTINYGRNGNEQMAKEFLIKRESGGDPRAKNPHSSAFGIGQLIKANREAYGKRLGIDPDTVNPNEQIRMMDEYVKDRYGSYSQARQFWLKNKWY